MSGVGESYECAVCHGILVNAPHDCPPAPPPIPPAEPWEATITRTGRWSWFASYNSGLIADSCSATFGWRARQRIEKRARRKVARLNRQERWREAPMILR